MYHWCPPLGWAHVPSPIEQGRTTLLEFQSTWGVGRNDAHEGPGLIPCHSPRVCLVLAPLVPLAPLCASLPWCPPGLASSGSGKKRTPMQALGRERLGNYGDAFSSRGAAYGPRVSPTTPTNPYKPLLQTRHSWAPGFRGRERGALLASGGGLSLRDASPAFPSSPLAPALVHKSNPNSRAWLAPPLSFQPFPRVG